MCWLFSIVQRLVTHCFAWQVRVDCFAKDYRDIFQFAFPMNQSSTSYVGYIPLIAKLGPQAWKSATLTGGLIKHRHLGEVNFLSKPSDVMTKLSRLICRHGGWNACRINDYFLDAFSTGRETVKMFVLFPSWHSFNSISNINICSWHFIRSTVS